MYAWLCNTLQADAWLCVFMTDTQRAHTHTLMMFEELFLWETQEPGSSANQPINIFKRKPPSCRSCCAPWPTAAPVCQALLVLALPCVTQHFFPEPLGNGVAAFSFASCAGLAALGLWVALGSCAWLAELQVAGGDSGRPRALRLGHPMGQDGALPCSLHPVLLE